MPAHNSYFIQKFLNIYPISTVELGDILYKRSDLGAIQSQELEEKLFAIPNESEANLTKELCRALFEFETSALAEQPNNIKTQTLLNTVLALIKSLDLMAIRPKESGIDRDWILLTPNINFTNPMALKFHARLVYRFGFVIEDQILNNNYTVSNISLVTEHASKDGTDRLAADLFLKCKAKFLLLNLITPFIMRNPNYDPAIPTSIKYFSDPAHSDKTIFLPALTTLLQELFRKIPILILHGMGKDDDLDTKYQVLLGNCYGKPREDGWPSFANMLSTSFAVEDFFINDTDRIANKPTPVVAVQGYIPNFVLKGDEKVPMSGTIGLYNTDGALRYTQGIISSNVTGHIAYYAEEPLRQRIKDGVKKCSDRAIHVETIGLIRDNTSKISAARNQVVSVIKRAIDWIKLYDPAIHDIHRLKERFIDVSNNMKLYSRLFVPFKMATYKKNKAETYIIDTQYYQNLWAATPQLPPPLLIDRITIQAERLEKAGDMLELLPVEEDNCACLYEHYEYEEPTPSQQQVIFSKIFTVSPNSALVNGEPSVKVEVASTPQASVPTQVKTQAKKVTFNPA